MDRFAGTFIAVGILSFCLTIRTFGSPVTTLAFTPDGTALVSNGPKTIVIRSVADGIARSSLPAGQGRITSLAFAPKGDLLVAAGGVPAVSGRVELFNWRDRRPVRHLTNDLDLATAAAFNSDGSLLGVASADHTARILSVEPSTADVMERFTLSGHAGPVLALAFSPSNRSLVTTSADRSVKVWSTEDGRLLRTFTHHTESVHAIAFRPVQDAGPVFCATAGDDRTVRVWQPEIGRMVRIVRGHSGPVFALVYGSDGASIYSAGKEGVIRRIDADSDTILREWQAHSDWIYSLAISPDGKRLASGDWSGEVRIWNLD